MQLYLSAGHSNGSPGRHWWNEMPSCSYFSPCQSYSFQFPPDFWLENLETKLNRYWSLKKPPLCVLYELAGSCVLQKEEKSCNTEEFSYEKLTDHKAKGGLSGYVNMQKNLQKMTFYKIILYKVTENNLLIIPFFKVIATQDAFSVALTASREKAREKEEGGLFLKPLWQVARASFSACQHGSH